MKKISLIILMLNYFLQTGCKKDPKNVQLSIDKTTVEKGQFVTLTVQYDGKVKWINFHQKAPNNNNFTDDENGNTWGNTTIKLDSFGVYTFYAIAYACSDNDGYEKLKKCKAQTKSNEVSVEVIFPCNDCDSLYRDIYFESYFNKLDTLTNHFSIEATQSMVDSSRIHAKSVADNLNCWKYFNTLSLVDYNLTYFLARLQYDSTLTQEEKDYYIALNTYCDFFPIAYPGKIQIKNCN